MTNTYPSSLIDAFAKLHILVIGEAILDSYLEGFSDRLCQEAPVPVVTLSNRKDVPGGAGNTAVNIRSLGAKVTFLSVVGDDLESELLREALAERGVKCDRLLTQTNRRTLAKHRVIASGQMVVRFDQGCTNSINLETEEKLIENLGELFPSCDAVIISDYGYGILTERVIEAIASLQSHSPKILVADSKNLAAYRNVGVTAVKPNYNEAMRLLGENELEESQTRASYIARNRKRILDITGTQIAAVTLDSDGALIFERGSPAYRTYAPPITHACVTGAGDTFISALTLSLAVGAAVPVAAELASAAAAIVVSKEGTAACSALELREYLLANNLDIFDLTIKKKTNREVA